ncbi:MAG: hypothetical protein ACJ71T_10795 [Actinomycetales bacterium]
MTAQRPARGTGARRAASVLVAVAASVALVSGPAISDDSRLTVTGVDTLGFPYVDLVVGGLAGPASSRQPPVTITQFGQRVPVTSSWLLSENQPLAVVTDADKASLAQVQGIVGELVQAMPPQVPLGLVSSTSERISAVGVNRDGFMTALGRQAASTARQVSVGITAAASAGIQHVFVVTTCGSPAPAAPPIGVIADVLGVGPRCTPAWRAQLSGRAGRFVSTADTGSALAALDAMVAQWRGSVVVVAQVSTRQPLQVSVGSEQQTVSLGEPVASNPQAPGGAEPASTSGSTSTSSSGGLVLGVGLVLLLFTIALVVFLAVRRPAGHHTDDLDTFELPPLHQPEAAPDLVASTARPPTIDLREHPDELPRMPLMAVATPGAVRQAERSLPATVATRDVPEEPVAMADKQFAAEDVVEEPVANVEVDTTQAPAEHAEQETDTEPAAEVEAVDALADEPAAEAVADEPAIDAVADEPADEAPDAPADRDQLAPIEFNWTPLQFNELTWRSDEDRLHPATIDLREPAAVDVREKAPRRTKSRRKTGH